MNKYRDEAPQPFTEEERLNIQLGKSFFWWFLETIFIKSFEGLTFTGHEGQREPFEFSNIHREWAVLAQFNPRMCLQAPRAHLKTTVIGQGGPFWLMFKAADNELVDGIYFSYKAELANEKVAALKRLILTNPYCRFWRDLKPTSENIIDFLVDWGDGPIAEVTLKGSGIKSATRGRHPKFVICDDILSDFSNPLASTELRLINRIFRQTIMSLPSNPDDILWLVGTPQAYDDILYQLAANEDWMWLIYPAISDWVKQKTQWPEKFDFERLTRIRKNIGETAFEVEYQLTPITVTDQFLTREDVLLAVDPQLSPWPVGKNFVNLDKLGTYAGMDIGKMVHPSHVSIFLEMPSGTLIQLYQRFLDNTNYVQQVKILNALAIKFQLTRGYYDNTRNELDDRGLSKRWRGRTFTNKLKADIAVKLEKRVFAESHEKGILLLGDERQIRSIVMVRKDLKADETPDGHGDAFWSNALAVKAADDGPVLVDIGSADPRSSLMKNQRQESPRDTIWRQLGGNQ
ncbi:hypothetical protein LCGC14_0264850 [marine sediment metagenome]|uniref:Terminase large subunit gp17-like C-terminal domain-containing protein n=1 Tax=marine sediment metagenome TaxID=412755 RepID=A0A0F9UHT7_9ZZZZ